MLKNFNISEFYDLLSNTTNDTVSAFATLVTTPESFFFANIFIPLRSIFFCFTLSLFVATIILRNREPIRSKFGVSTVWLIMSMLHSLQVIYNVLPMRQIVFGNYWDQFLVEKAQSGISATNFYWNKMTNGVPSWMSDLSGCSNAYCYIVAFAMAPYVILASSAYFMQLIQFMLLRVLNDKKENIKKAIEALKKKRIENLMKKKQQNSSHSEKKPTTPRGSKKEQSEVITPRQSVTYASQVNLELMTVSTTDALLPPSEQSTPTQSSSQTDATVMPSLDLSRISIATIDNAADETDRSWGTFDTDEYETDDTVSSVGEDYSSQGRTVNYFKFVIKYRIVQIFILVLLAIIWYIIAFFTLFQKVASPMEVIFPLWKTTKGLCYQENFSQITTYLVILTSIVFFIIPVVFMVDLIVSIEKYYRYRKLSKQNGDNHVGFFRYYFDDTDPFFYRLEALSVMFFEIGGMVLLVIFTLGGAIGPYTQLGNEIVSLFVLDLFGGNISFPGITVLATLRNMWHQRSKTTSIEHSNKVSTINNLDDLMKNPTSEESVDYLINHPTERDLFYGYLNQEFSSENLIFVEDLIKFRKVPAKRLRSKLSKLKDMIKLYLTDVSIFEVNLPKKLINEELAPYFKIEHLLSRFNMKIETLPKIVKDMDSSILGQGNQEEEKQLKQAIVDICSSSFLSQLRVEVYRNLMDSYSRFINSRKWSDHLKSVNKV